MWNGYDCREVTSAGAQKCGIEKTRARWSAAAFCSTSPLQGRGNRSTTATASPPRSFSTPPRRRRSSSSAATSSSCAPGTWNGASRREAGTAIPAATLPACVRDAGIRAEDRACRPGDRYLGAEVRPNNTEGNINQPWHWITIPIMGMDHGEIFNLKELRDDCAPTRSTSSCSLRPRSDHRRGRLRRSIRWRSSRASRTE